MSKKVPLHRLLQPTMVSNGRGGLPRHRYTSRLRMNPSDDPWEGLGGGGVSVEETPSKASSRLSSSDSKAGFRALSRKLEAEKYAELEARFAKEKGPKKPDRRGERLRRLWQEEPERMRAILAKGQEVRKEKAAARREIRAEIAAGKEELRSELKALKDASKKSAEELAVIRARTGAAVGLIKKAEKEQREAEMKAAQSPLERARLRLKWAQERADKADETLRERLRIEEERAITQERKDLEAAERASRPKMTWAEVQKKAHQTRKDFGALPKAVKKVLTPHAARQLGLIKNSSGYSLTRNPVVDFELGGIKVLPAVCGVAGASFLTAGISSIDAVQKIENETVRTLLPAAVTVGIAVAGYSWAKKNGHELTEQICSDLTAFGIFQGVNSLIAKHVDKAVKSIKSSASQSTTQKTLEPPPPKKDAPAGFSGGRFTELSGGGWGTPSNLPATSESLSGYVTMNGDSSGYPQAFLTGDSGYPPASLYGVGSDSATALQAVALAGGAFIHKSGHDMSEYAD